MGRLHFLDYLRGIAALGIMLFHYSCWVFGEPEHGGFMARVGIYGVSVFYVLSGLKFFMRLGRNYPSFREQMPLDSAIQSMISEADQK